MALYRCHFLDVQDRIKAHEEINAGSLLDAIDQANAMLNEAPHHDAVEVWAGSRWIYRAGGKGICLQANSATRLAASLMQIQVLLH